MIDIDMTTLVVVIVLLGAIAAVFVYHTVKGKKAQKQFLEKFNEFVSGLQLNPQVKEDWRRRFILGIDHQKNTLVYCNFGETEEKIAVSLAEVSKVTVSETFQEVAQSANTRKIIEQLALNVHFRKPGKEALSLLIYSAEDYSDLLGETVLAANWASTINQQLSK